MKKTLGIRKLTLQRETIRNLGALREVVGGIIGFSSTCTYTRQNSCDTITLTCGATLGVACDISFTPTVCG